MKEEKSFGNKVLKVLGIDRDSKQSFPMMINYNWAVFLGNGSFYIIGLFLMPFLTKVEGLTPLQAGNVILFAKICDAITDPAMGIITDRTRSRLGRHRPYLIIGLVPVMISYFMMWYSFGISNGNTTAKMMYFIGAYMLFSTAYTVVMVPHTAMLPELAPKYNLRTQYNAVKTIIDAVGTEVSFLVATLILSYTSKPGRNVFQSVVSALGNTPKFDPSFKHRFMIMGLVLCLFFSLPLLATFFGTKEKSSKDEKFPPFNFREFTSEYKSIAGNRAFRQYFALSFFNCVALGFISNSSVFFLDNVVDMFELYTITTFISQAGEASGFPINYLLSINMNKQTPAKIELPFIIASLLLSFAVRPGGSKAVLIAVYILYNLGIAGVNSVTGNIFPDVTDFDEMISGERREGKISTFSTLIKKLVSGLAAATTGLILSFFGFSADAEVNTAKALFGVRFTYAILPIIFIIFSIISVYRYKMTKSSHALIKRAIKEKKETGTTTLTADEKALCEEISGQKWDNMWIGQN